MRVNAVEGKQGACDVLDTMQCLYEGKVVSDVN